MKIIVFAAAAVAALFLYALIQGPRTAQLQLSLVDRNGNRQDLGSVPSATFAPRIAPNGTQVTFDTTTLEPAIWIADFPTLKSMRRLPGVGIYPMWSADSERLFFIGLNNGRQALYSRRADGTVQPELLSDPARAPEHWSPKTQSITFITLNESDYDIWQYSFADKKAMPLIQIGKSSQHSSRVSPDERWIAYVSDETSRYEVYVQPLPPTGTKFQITKDGGGHPVWSPDAREIYFDRGGQLYSVAVQIAGSTLAAGSPAALPIKGFIQDVGRRQFDITADGKQFLMLFPPR